MNINQVINSINTFNNNHFRNADPIEVTELSQDEKDFLLGNGASGVSTEQILRAVLTKLKESTELYYNIYRSNPDFSCHGYISFAGLYPFKQAGNMLDIRIGLEHLSHIIGVSLTDLAIPGSYDSNHHVLYKYIEPVRDAVLKSMYPRTERVQGNFTTKVRSLGFPEEQERKVIFDIMLIALPPALDGILNNPAKFNKFVRSFKNDVSGQGRAFIPNVFRIAKKAPSFHDILTDLELKNEDFDVYRNSVGDYLIITSKPNSVREHQCLEFGIDEDKRYFVRSILTCTPTEKNIIDNNLVDPINMPENNYFSKYVDCRKRQNYKFFKVDSLESTLWGGTGDRLVDNYFENVYAYIKDAIENNSIDAIFWQKLDSLFAVLINQLYTKKDRKILYRFVSVLKSTLTSIGINLNVVMSKCNNVKNIEDFDKIWEYDQLVFDIRGKIDKKQVVKELLDSFKLEQKELLSNFISLTEQEKRDLGRKFNDIMDIIIKTNRPGISVSTFYDKDGNPIFDSTYLSSEDILESDLELAIKVVDFDEFEKKSVECMEYLPSISVDQYIEEIHRFARESFPVEADDKSQERKMGVYLKYKEYEMVYRILFMAVTRLNNIENIPSNFIRNAPEYARQHGYTIKTINASGPFDLFNEISADEVKKIILDQVDNEKKTILKDVIHYKKIISTLNLRMNKEYAVSIQPKYAEAVGAGLGSPGGLK